MRIVASAEPASSPAPDVTVMSSAGASAADPADDDDGQAQPGQFAYEAPLPDDTIVSVRAVLVDGRTAASDTKTVRTDGTCAGEVAFDAGRGTQAGPSLAPAPATSAAGGAAPAPEPPPPPPASSGPQPAPEPGREGAAPGPPAEPGAEGAAPGPPAEPGAEGAAPGPPAEPGAEGAAAGPPPALPAPGGGDAGAAPAPQEPPPQPPREQEQPGQGGGCLVATAAHGTELAPQVQALRELRDNTVLSTGAGSAFMAAFAQAYYAVSPQVADLERAHPALRQAAALALAPMLHALGVVSLAEPGSEAGVAAYGALAIALVAGMYVAAPAAGVWCLARRAGILRGRPPAAGRSG